MYISCKYTPSTMRNSKAGGEHFLLITKISTSRLGAKKVPIPEGRKDWERPQDGRTQNQKGLAATQDCCAALCTARNTS